MSYETLSFDLSNSYNHKNRIRINTFNERLEYNKKIEKELSKLKRNDNICLDKDVVDIITDIKKIATKSKFGTAYMGKILGKTYDISIKTIPLSDKEINNKNDTHYSSWREIETMRMTTDLVNNQICPHFSVLYKTVICYDCDYGKKIDGISHGMCAHVFNELSNFDLREYLLRMNKMEKKLDNTILRVFWKNLFFQVWYSIAVLQSKFQIIHRDLHWGNILINLVDPVGYTIYEYSGIKFYVPNVGFYIKIWDFGKVSSLTKFRMSNRDMEFLHNSNESNKNEINKYAKDIYRFSNIYKWLRNNLDFNNGDNLVPEDIKNICRVIRKKDILISSYNLIFEYMRLYLNNHIGRRLLKTHEKKLINKKIYNKGEIVVYKENNKKRYGMIFRLHGDKVEIIIKRVKSNYLKMVSVNKIEGFEEELENDLEYKTDKYKYLNEEIQGYYVLD